MTARTSPVTLTPLLGFPEVEEGDDLAGIVLKALQHNGIRLIDGDIVVVSSKVASKAMGLNAPSAQQAEVVLSHTVRVVAERMTRSGVTRIVESAAGPVMTAAGLLIDIAFCAALVFVISVLRGPAVRSAIAARVLRRR